MAKVIVFDLGSHCLRVGLANQHVSCPKLSIPAVVGYPRNHTAVAFSGEQRKEKYVGLEAGRFRSVCDVVRPISHGGKIDRPADLALLIEQAYHMMGVASSEVPCVVSEPLDATRAHREELAKLFLCDFRVPSLLIVTQGVTAVFSAGDTSGIVADFGEGATRSIAVVDGIALPHTSVATPLGGATLTAAVKAALIDSGQAFAQDHVGSVKEALCFASPRPLDGASPEEDAVQEYRLPDGQVVCLSQERYRCCEVLFGAEWESPRRATGGDPEPRSRAPSVVMPKAHHSVSAIVALSAAAVDHESREFLFRRVVLCGGTAMLRGIESRVENELLGTRHVGADDRRLFAVKNVSAVAPSDRSWAGAAIFGGLSTAAALFTTQEDIAEQGFAAVHRHRAIE